MEPDITRMACCPIWVKAPLLRDTGAVKAAGGIVDKKLDW